MPISPRRELLHASDVLVLSGALVFAAATQGTCLDHLALEARGLTLPGPIRL